MSVDGAKSKPVLGFLTVLDHAKHGLFGGYLILNSSGRPVEFHCTAPIRPNRAQQILYGPTLESFLYGEQIGGTLLSKAGSEVTLVCTDCLAAMAVREHVDVPVALIVPDNPPASDSPREFRRIDPTHSAGANSGIPHLVTFELGRNRLAVNEETDEVCAISACLAEMPESFDLAEPFARIREAIEEARQAAK